MLKLSNTTPIFKKEYKGSKCIRIRPFVNFGIGTSALELELELELILQTLLFLVP